VGFLGLGRFKTSVFPTSFQADRLQKRLADTEAALVAREQAVKEGSKETSRCTKKKI